MLATAHENVRPSSQLLHMIFDSFILSRAISVAAELGIADLLVASPQTADELARLAGVNAPALYRVLRALVSQGIFTEDEAGKFHLTPLAESLRSDVSDNWRAYSMMLGSDWAYRAYGNLLYSVQTGQPAFDHVFGKPLMTYLSENPDQASIFNAAMTNTSQQSAPVILEAYNFSGIHKLVDVGGGYGFLLTSILKAYPHLHGILFDQPHVVSEAVTAEEVTGRYEIVGGNFFDSVPNGGDAYIMQYVLHGMDDEQALQLLQNVRRVIPQNGVLLQVDMVVPEGNQPSTSKFGNLHMMIFAPSHERSEAEYCALYERAGFKLTRVLQTPSVFSILEGKPI